MFPHQLCRNRIVTIGAWSSSLSCRINCFLNRSCWINCFFKSTQVTGSDYPENVQWWLPHRPHIITSEKYLKHNFGNLFSNAIIKVSQCKFEAAWRDRGRYIAVSAVIESPSAGTLVNFGELRGGKTGGGGKPFGESRIPFICIIYYLPKPQIYKSKCHMCKYEKMFSILKRVF